MSGYRQKAYHPSDEPPEALLEPVVHGRHRHVQLDQRFPELGPIGASALHLSSHEARTPLSPGAGVNPQESWFLAAIEAQLLPGSLDAHYYRLEALIELWCGMVILTS
jgi:hypothetical protein